MAQFLVDDALGLGLRHLQPHLPGIVLAHLAIKFFELLFPEFLAAQAPAPAQGLESLLVAWLQAPRLEPPIKFLPRRRAVLLQSMLAQQAIYSHPLWPVSRGGQIVAEAAPGVGQQPLIWRYLGPP